MVTATTDDIKTLYRATPLISMLTLIHNHFLKIICNYTEMISGFIAISHLWYFCLPINIEITCVCYTTSLPLVNLQNTIFDYIASSTRRVYHVWKQLLWGMSVNLYMTHSFTAHLLMFFIYNCFTLSILFRRKRHTWGGVKGQKRRS